LLQQFHLGLLVAQQTPPRLEEVAVGVVANPQTLALALRVRELLDKRHVFVVRLGQTPKARLAHRAVVDANRDARAHRRFQQLEALRVLLSLRELETDFVREMDDLLETKLVCAPRRIADGRFGGRFALGTRLLVQGVSSQ
jgi:hypothetical protein